LRRGDTVAVNPFLYCYRCRYCKLGRLNLCLNLRALEGAAELGRRIRLTCPAYLLDPKKTTNTTLILTSIRC